MRTIHLDNDYEVNEFIIENLKEENKELKEKYTQVLEVAQDRFDRIQKAIEYIKEHSTTIDYKTMRADYNLNMNDLLDILKGGKDE